MWKGQVWNLEVCVGTFWGDSVCFVTPKKSKFEDDCQLLVQLLSDLTFSIYLFILFYSIGKKSTGFDS